MTRRKDPRGRPSIGQPEQVWGRVSEEVRDQVEDLSAEHGISRARVVAALVEAGLANLDLVQFPKPARKSQQELPLNKAS